MFRVDNEINWATPNNCLNLAINNYYSHWANTCSTASTTTKIKMLHQYL